MPTSSTEPSPSSTHDAANAQWTALTVWQALRAAEVHRGHQAHLLKAHGRRYSRLLWFRFGDCVHANHALALRLSRMVTTSWDQLVDRFLHRRATDPDFVATMPAWWHGWDPVASGHRSPESAMAAAAGLAPCVQLSFTHRGLRVALGLRDGAQPASRLIPADRDFRQGLETAEHRMDYGLLPQHATLGGADDPWESPYHEAIDGLLLVAHAREEDLEAVVRRLTVLLHHFGAHIVTEESGFAWKPLLPGRAPVEREPFGFADGFTVRDPRVELGVESAGLDSSPFDILGMEERLRQIEIRAPAGLESPTCGGSYAVVMKLEQDVAAFSRWEDASRDPCAAARLMGRDREGRPLAKIGAQPLDNEFTYDDDRAATPRCPYHAHIRKANPRLPHEAEHQFVRRSLIYGRGGPDSKSLEGPQGMLFLGYMGSIERQFRVVFREWLLGAASPELGRRSRVGADPLFASMAPREPWEQDKPASNKLPKFIHPRGARFLFVPTLDWFSRLAETQAAPPNGSEAKETLRP